MMDWSKLIDKAHKTNEDHGIPVKGGKKYAQVSTRVELFRREFGGSMSIETEIVKFGAAKGEPVAVKATIRDETSRIIATGHAYEIVGMGGVNQGAALENCETSAVGRALAFLGIHGGEIASLHEIEAFDRKKDAADQVKPANEAKPSTPKQPTKADQSACDAMIGAIRQHGPSVGSNEKFKADLERLRKSAPELAAQVDAELETKQQGKAA